MSENRIDVIAPSEVANTPLNLPSGIEWTLREARITDANLSFDDWSAALRAASEVKRAMSFVIGDLIIFGDGRYGERYAQAIDLTGLVYETLATYVYVCEHVRPSRRRTDLGFGHHKAVAALEPAAQKIWLERAATGGWSREKLRNEIRGESSSRDEKPRERPATMTPEAALIAVDAARDLSTIRETLSTLTSPITSEEGREAAGVPAALRALDEVGKTVRRAAEAIARPSLLDAARRVTEAGVKQRALADPAYIVPAAVFEELVDRVAESSGS